MPKWVGVFVICAGTAALSPCCHAAEVARGDTRLAQALLARIEASRQKVSNFSCTVVDSFTGRAIGSVDPTGRDIETRHFAFDSTGRGRVELVLPAGGNVHIWDGNRSFQYTSSVAPYSGDAVIRDRQQPETSLRSGSPWTLWGEKFCGFLRRAMTGRPRISVKVLDDDMYRMEAAYGDGGKGVALVDGRHGYTVIRQEYYMAGELQQSYCSRFQQLKPDVWFPVEGEHVRFYKAADGTTHRIITSTKITSIVLNAPDFARHLTFELPFGTEVSDYTGGRHYVAGCRSEFTLSESETDVHLAIASSSMATAPDTLWQEAFNAVYSLESGESLRRIAPPFIPQRVNYANSLPRKVANLDHTSMVWNWDDHLVPRMYWQGRFVPLHAIIENMLGLDCSQIGGSTDLLNIRLAGDWIIRRQVPTGTLLAALQQIIQYETSRRIKFVSRPVPTRVVVASGKCRIKPDPEAADNRIHLFTDGSEEPHEDGTGTLAALLEYISHRFARPVIDRTRSSTMTVSWRGHGSAWLDSPADSAGERDTELGRVLGNLADQTGLSFDVETMPVEKWSVIELAESR